MGLGRELRTRLDEVGLVGTGNKARLIDWDHICDMIFRGKFYMINVFTIGTGSYVRRVG